MTPLEKK